MKKAVFSCLLIISFSAVVIIGSRLVYLDREAWTCSQKLVKALGGARAVTLTEYTSGRIIVEKAATADEIVRLQDAASKGLRPFWPETAICWEPHHSLQIVRADGSEVTVEICFLCGKFGFLSDNEPVVPIPGPLNGSLTAFFASVGMRPKTRRIFSHRSIKNGRGRKKIARRAKGLSNCLRWQTRSQGFEELVGKNDELSHEGGLLLREREWRQQQHGADDRWRSGWRRRSD